MRFVWTVWSKGNARALSYYSIPIFHSLCVCGPSIYHSIGPAGRMWGRSCETRRRMGKETNTPTPPIEQQLCKRLKPRVRWQHYRLYTIKSCRKTVDHETHTKYLSRCKPITWKVYRNSKIEGIWVDATWLAVTAKRLMQIVECKYKKKYICLFRHIPHSTDGMPLTDKSM